MASLSAPVPQLGNCTAYCTVDGVIGHIIVFYSPQPSIGVARVEAHILTCAGFQSYPKLILSPSSPLYAAVNHLPIQKQSSEIHRGLAVALFKYFSELSKVVKETILKSKSNAAPAGEGQAVAFDEMHAGDLAARLKEIESPTLANDLMCALSERFVNSLEVDVVVRRLDKQDTNPDEVPEDVEKLLACFGEPTHLPFAKLKRTLSRPASSRPAARPDRTEALERELEELRRTEESYVGKLQELSEDIVQPLRRKATQKKGESGSLTSRDLDALFPPCLERIIEVNLRFLDSIREGTLEAVAKVCLETFPDFKKPYEEYLRASADFPILLAKFTKDKGSSFSKRIQQTGEQKLRSLIIEPVQRLPRYSLLIDNIIELLPLTSPAGAHLNEARSVITEICSLQSSEKDERSTTIKRLQSIVVSWPLGLRPRGRLITAVDFIDVLPPFNDISSESIPSVLLLFADCVAILRRPKATSLLARSIVAEVDRPGGGSGSGSKRDTTGQDLQFAGWIDLADIRLCESDDGATAWVTLSSHLKDCWDVRAGGMGIRKMRLLNQYEGRASKVEEEFVKARLERRSNASQKGILGLREVRYSGLNLWSCVWGSLARHAEEKRKSSTTVYLEIGGSGKSGAAKELSGAIGTEGVDIAVSVEETKGTMLRIECRSWNDYSSTDIVPRDEFLAVFSKRISSLLRLHTSPQHPPLTGALMSAHRKLLRSLNVPFDGEHRFSKLRPPSPVKLFSSILNTPGTPSKKPVLLERSQSQLLPPRQLDRPISLFHRGATVLGIGDDEAQEDTGNRQRITMSIASPLRKLEETFEAFVQALRITGSEDDDLTALHDLHNVDRSAVDALAEQLISDPKEVRLGKELGIDTVVLAFGRFLNQEWKDGMGAVISHKTLAELQEKSDTLFPGDFEDFFRIFMLDWTPQNKRAFKTIILLLKEMQEKVSREDLKGVLTKCFTELLVGEDVNPLDYMGLVDRLVEDRETLFREAPAQQYPEGSLAGGSPSMKRAKSVTSYGPTGTSSLRKRFGLTHTSSVRESPRGNGTDEPKSHSVWRTLSKRDKDSFRGHVSKSKSHDFGAATTVEMPKRPSSRDLMLGTFKNNSSSSLSSRPLSTILAAPAPLSMPPPEIPLRRKKRRSSLSDLTTHPEYKKLLAPNLSPASDSCEKASSDVESMPSVPLSTDELRLEPEIAPLTLKKKDTHRKSIPSPVTPQRLKIQSPQKLRERLQPEKSAPSADASLLAEISKLSDELNSSLSLDSKYAAFQSRLRALESQAAQQEVTQKKQEQELKDADRLLKDCTDENDVMFETFNRELAKMAAAFKAGKAESEALRILQEVRADQGRLKRENMRLRRENISLKGSTR